MPPARVAASRFILSLIVNLSLPQLCARRVMPGVRRLILGEPMKLLNHVSMILAFAVCCFMACVVSAIAQKPPSETQIIKGDANSCELNSLYLDNLISEQRANGERIFAIARLGRGEVKRSLRLNRLEYARLYLIESGRTQKEKVVFAEGERVDGEGRVEFYPGSKLYLVSLAERGKNVCLTCCKDYIPPRRGRRKGRR